MPNSSITEPWRAVQRNADAFAPRFAEPFIASVEALRRRVTLALIEESVVKGELTWELAAAIDQVKIAKSMVVSSTVESKPKLQEIVKVADPAELASKVYSQLIVATVTNMAEWAEAKFGVPGAQIVGRFNITSPQVLRAAQTLTADAIREVLAETKMAVRRLIFNSIRDGVAPRAAAKQIRDTLGLTTRQALAVNRLEVGLLEGGAEPAFVRAQGKRYSDRLLRDRAENVARTETMRAANRGQQMLWSEMADAGVIGQDFGQRWLVTPDDRLCARCAPMAEHPSVQLGYLFRETQNGILPSKRKPVAGATVLSPPLHPRCRCVLVFDDDLG